MSEFNNVFQPSNKDKFYYDALVNAVNNNVNIRAISVDWNPDGSCYFKTYS